MPNRLRPDVDFGTDQPWVPGLATRLVGPALATRGLTAATYRTRRWLGADQSNNAPTSLFESPPPALIGPYGAMGLQFASAVPPKARRLLEAAFGLLQRVPEVGAAVTALVRAVHLLDGPGEGIDLSHSDPSLPCSIFLSLPVGEPHAPLRAAESVLHEAMHLQLTLLEAEKPVVRPSASTLYSPWQQRQRPVSGLVHGLYVFAVVDAYLVALLAQLGRERGTADFARKRRAEIAAEIGEAAAVAGHQDLTPFGRQLVEALAQSSAPAP